MLQVKSAAPVAPWLGGKKVLSARIIERIEALPHKTYVEPFTGMGGVFLRRRFKPRQEVANDLNGEIINLFRILQRHYPQLMEVMRFQIASRKEFERLRACDPIHLTDLERAARFLYLQRLSFGGQVNGVFGVAPTTGPRFSLARLEILLEEARERLDGVILECLDWSAVVERYDTPDTLFTLIRLTLAVRRIMGRACLIGASLKRWPARLPESQARFFCRSMTRRRSGRPSHNLRLRKYG